MTSQTAPLTKPAYKTCSVDGCDRKHNARGWCETHYSRWQTHGDPRADIPVRRHKTEGCAVEGCLRDHFCRGWCNAHYSRWHENGDLRADEPIKVRHPDEPAYVTVHQRIARERGSASEHKCVGCGDQAEHWSYDHSDHNEKLDDRGCPYSTDLDRYEPRCQPCHTKFDRNPHA